MRKIAQLVGVFLLSLTICLPVRAFSIPGLVPTNYKRGDKLPILAGNLMSTRTELLHDFYDLNWCNNTIGGGYDLKPVAKNLRGVNLVNSPMDVSAFAYPFFLSTLLEWAKTVGHAGRL